MAVYTHPLPPISSFPAPIWPLGVGLLINSSILFGNVGWTIAGPMPIIQDKLGKSGLSAKEKVRVWNLFFAASGGAIVPGVIASTIAHSLAAYFTTSSTVRQLSIIAGLSELSMIPYTLTVIMPTNKRLMALDKSGTFTPIEEKEALQQIDEWEKWHNVRYLCYISGWVCGLGALLEVVRLSL